MAEPTLVNGQITDAVTQANVQVLGTSPAQALGTMMQVCASAVGISMQNMVAHQQQLNTIGGAVTTACVNALMPKGPERP